LQPAWQHAAGPPCAPAWCVVLCVVLSAVPFFEMFEWLSLGCSQFPAAPGSFF
jgi:hypothetical protein